MNDLLTGFNRYKKRIIAINIIVVILLFNYSIFKKEETLEKGNLILFKLAPVDPRSLMQGDYMVLRYALLSEFGWQKTRAMDRRGFCTITVDENSVATSIKQCSKYWQKPLLGEYAIGYKNNQNSLKIGAESYLFEEGRAKSFDAAKYGGLRVDDKGKSILVGLYDEHRNLIK